MSELIVQSTVIEPRPLPQVDVTIRAGVISDIPFLDSLQKLHTKQVGWMPTKQFEGKIKLGHVLVAETTVKDEGGRMNDETESAVSSAAAIRPSSFLLQPSPTPVGYLIGNDQYFKRDDLGIIYQMNVAPGRQRGLIGASLLKAQFERSAYGCKLYCCWCAQDIAANHFWESMGFVPLAFRAGSEKKSRVHIFWQKRIRKDDVTTPWWFPSKTAGGAIREDRIVLPIPPGTHWSDAKPLLLPGDGFANDNLQFAIEDKATASVAGIANRKSQIANPKRGKATKVAVESPAPIRRNGLIFDIPQQGEVLPETKPAKEPKPKPERVKRTCDPRLVSAARELRDRWLEQVNATPLLSQGKYDVSRMIDDKMRVEVIEPMKLLTAA